MEVELNLYEQVMLDKREDPEHFLERLPLRAEILEALENKSISYTEANVLFHFHNCKKQANMKVTFSETPSEGSKKRKSESSCELDKATGDPSEENCSLSREQLIERNTNQATTITSLLSQVASLLEEVGALKEKLSLPTLVPGTLSECPTEKDSSKSPETVDIRAPYWIAGISKTEKNKDRTYRKLVKWTSSGAKTLQFQWLDVPLEKLGSKKSGKCTSRWGENAGKEITYEVWVDTEGNKIEGTWREELLLQ